jgi:hypothetical protein
MQINHPGRQAQGSSAPDGKTVAPSATPFLPPANGMSPTPRTLTSPEVSEIVENFAATASLAKDDAPRRIVAGHGFRTAVTPVTTGIKFLDDRVALETHCYGVQLGRLARNWVETPEWSLLCG